VKNATDYAKRLTQLLRQLAKAAPDRQVFERDPIEQFIHSFLCWESSHNQADQALARLMREVVDYNDLRVTDPADLIKIIGDGYALAEERVHRLSRALHAVYKREHQMSLGRLVDMPKREAREYLDGLDGMVPFVSASVLLLSFEGHAVPVDDQLHQRLRRDDIVDAEATLAETQSFLESHIRAADGLESYILLRAYVERPIKVDLGAGPAAKAKSVTRTTKKSTKKKTSKATTKKTKKTTQKKSVRK
jgi:endonuclease III